LKKVLTLSFVALFIANVFELHQLAKLPALMHHYSEHKSENQHQSFAEFLTDHYFEQHDHATQNHKHDDLPFKSSDCSSFHGTIAFIQTLACSHYQPELFLTDLIKQPTVNFYFQNFVGKIWQPPKI
jgi:hypothetical protein